MERDRPLDELNQRELLILLNQKVQSLENKMDEKNKTETRILLDINTLQVTLRERSMIWGMVGSLVMSGVIQLLIFLSSK